MGNFVDRAIVRAALTAQPRLRDNLRDLAQRLTCNAFAESELCAIEEEIVAAIRVVEALGMPSAVPAADQPLQLSAAQFDTMKNIIARFRNPRLRQRVETLCDAALNTGRMHIIRRA